jgi:ubiquinone/menaquinone biosynthesis C-methylase UbiE
LSSGGAVLPQPKSAAYHDRFNEPLFRAVPTSAGRVLDVGCAEGRLGLELKRQIADRYVAGVEIDADAAAVASTRLDAVYLVDIEESTPDVAAGSFDCIVFGDVLEHLQNPEAALRRFRSLLAPGGSVVVSVPNLQHASVMKSLVRGDFMYQPEGLLDSTHVRFFTHMSFTKLMLDAGYLPRIDARVGTGDGAATAERATPLLQLHGVRPDAAVASFDTYQYIFSGTALNLPDEPFASEPITFVVCSGDAALLESNLHRSPCLDPGTPHELLVLEGQRSTAEGYRVGWERATNDLVVFVAEDVYLPRNWDSQLVEKLRAAEARFGALGVAGVYGYRVDDTAVAPVGRLVDRDELRDHPEGLPARASGLDDAVLVLRRDSPLHFDPALGSHLHGVDLALQATAADLPAVVLDVPCLRNALSRAPIAEVDAARHALRAKWPDVGPFPLDETDEHSDAPTWYDEYLEFPARLAAEAARVADLQATLDATELELADRRRHIENMETSVFWRARRAVHRVLRRG